MTSFDRFIKNNVTYLNILNSGNLSLITDYELRQQIVSYYKNLDDHDVLEEYVERFGQDIYIPFYMDTFNAFTQTFVSEDFHKSIQFTNMFGTLYSFRQQRLAEYRNLLVSSRDLLEKLKALP